MLWKRQSRFSRKFGRNTPWGGHRRFALPFHIVLASCGGILVSLFLCIVLLAVANVLPTKAVEVDYQGVNGLYTAEQVLDASGLRHIQSDTGAVSTTGYFRFEASKVREAVMKELPLLKDVRVLRRLDGKVVIRVTEHTDIYYTYYHQNWYALSSKDLRVIDVASKKDPTWKKIDAVYLELPSDARVRLGEVLSFEYRAWQEDESDITISYEGETKSAEEQYRYVKKTLETYRKSELFSHTVGIDLSDPYDVYAVVAFVNPARENPVKISFGTYDDMEEKIQKVIEGINAYVQTNNQYPSMYLINAKDAKYIGFQPANGSQFPSWAVN